MKETNNEIMSRGMRILAKEMGIIEAEEFISIILRNRFDYTEWKKNSCDTQTLEDIRREAAEYEAAHPSIGNPVRV